MDERSGDSSGTQSIRAAQLVTDVSRDVPISAWVLENDRNSSVMIQACLVQRTSPLTFVRRIEV